MTEKDALAIASTFTTPPSTRICYFFNGRHLRQVLSFHAWTHDSQAHNTKRAAYVDFNCQYILDSLPYFSDILPPLNYGVQRVILPYGDIHLVIYNKMDHWFYGHAS